MRLVEKIFMRQLSKRKDSKLRIKIEGIIYGIDLIITIIKTDGDIDSDRFWCKATDLLVECDRHDLLQEIYRFQQSYRDEVLSYKHKRS